METINEKLKIITPCFCAGANQETAELRAPSIRGQLRWWFRVLGGTPEEEKELFGGVHNGTAASKIVVRVKNVNSLYGSPNELPQQNKCGYYLFHFTNASNKPRGVVYGPRYQNEAWFKPSTSFEVECRSKLPMTETEEKRFKMTWDAFTLLGSLGLRQTRGLGAFTQENPPSYSELKERLSMLSTHGIKFWRVINLGGKTLTTPNWLDSLTWLEAVLGWIRHNGFSAGRNGNNYTPLGTSTPRQASAIHLRPVRIKEQEGSFISLLFFTPQILGDSRQNNELLQLLNSGRPIKTPYNPNPRQPDQRDEIMIRPF